MAYFFSGGGFPGGFSHESFSSGGRGRSSGPKEPVDTDKFYNCLGVEKTATKAQIRKAYLKKSMKAHPDKGGDPEKFKEMQKAYEVLYDEDKREVYDQYGEEGLENGGGGGGPEDMMNAFFGGGGRQRRGPQKGEDSDTEFKVSLEDLYRGKVTKIALNKSVYKVDPRGMIQDSRGRRLTKSTERKKLEIEIDRGMKDGQVITLSGEGDQIPDVLPGDIKIHLKEKEHPVFKRKGCDLFIKQTISLCDALTGVAFTIETLDKRTLFVETKPGQVIQPDSIMQIDDEGMPMYRHPEEHGCLFIQFKVEFPENLQLSAAQCKALQGIIGSAMTDRAMLTDDMEAVTLKPMDEQAAQNRERTRRHFSGENDTDSRSTGMGGAQNVQCAQG